MPLHLYQLFFMFYFFLQSFHDLKSSHCRPDCKISAHFFSHIDHTFKVLFLSPAYFFFISRYSSILILRAYLLHDLSFSHSFYLFSEYYFIYPKLFNLLLRPFYSVLLQLTVLLFLHLSKLWQFFFHH